VNYDPKFNNIQLTKLTTMATQDKSVFIVDDIEENLEIISELLTTIMFTDNVLLLKVQFHLNAVFYQLNLI